MRTHLRVKTKYEKEKKGEEMKRKLFVFSVVAAAALYSYLLIFSVDTKTVFAADAKKTYVSTIYIAGMGGHFAQADIVIDPNNADNPLKIEKLTRLLVGPKESYPLHDPRIDVKDNNTMFWSTYILDPNGKMHVGKIDLVSKAVKKDIVLAAEPRAPKKSPLFCSSGQSENNYLPVFMGSDGFIDVFDKKTLDHKHRVFISDLGYKNGSYKFVHGTNSPDMKKFLVVVNEGENEKGTGHIDLLLVDLHSLERGKWKVLAKNTITGEPDKAIAFRGHFSSDGKYIFQSGADRMWVLNASTLKLVDEKMIPEGGQVHDILPTPDGKYAVLTVRMLAIAPGAETKEATDGFIMLYDFDNRKLAGKPTSTCMACHRSLDVAQKKSAVLCGVDGIWK